MIAFRGDTITYAQKKKKRKQDGTLSSAYKKNDKGDYCNSRYGESKKKKDSRKEWRVKRKKKKVEGRKNKKNEISSTFLSTLVDLWNGDQI